MEIKPCSTVSITTTTYTVPQRTVPQVVSENWGASSVEMTLRQDWFLADGSGSTGLEGEEGEVVWSIPLCFASSTQVTSNKF